MLPAGAAAGAVAIRRRDSATADHYQPVRRMTHKDEFHEPNESMCFGSIPFATVDFVEFVTSSAGCLSVACGSLACGNRYGPEFATELFVVHPPNGRCELRLGLVSRYIDQTPGNAAVQYMRASLALADNKAYRDCLREFPIGSIYRSISFGNTKMPEFFQRLSDFDFDLIRFAANKDFCEWELPFREFNMETRIPELWWWREMARLMALKTRIEISRRQLTQAMETIKTGMAIGRHAAEGPTFVNGLVGVSITLCSISLSCSSSSPTAQACTGRWRRSRAMHRSSQRK